MVTNFNRELYMISFVLYGQTKYGTKGFYCGTYEDSYSSSASAKVTSDIADAIVFQAEFVDCRIDTLSVVGGNSLPPDYSGDWSARAVTVGIKEI